MLAIVTLAVTAVLGEIMLRVKNSDQRNYTIEMWRYAKELKEINPNPDLGHTHIPNSSAQLQGIDFKINQLGMRGPEAVLDDQSRQKALLLGSSITLGWGVQEEESLRAQLEKGLNGRYQVLNGSVGNYNAKRSVALFTEKWRKIVKPDVVIFHYFINDAEYLPPSSNNFLVRNSQLAVTLYYIFQRMTKGSSDVSALVDHYREVYDPQKRGYKEMLSALKKLNEMAKEDGFRVIFTLVPDIHQLENYPFNFIHQKMREIVKEFDWDFVDFLDDLKGFKGPELWTIPGDPHPNAQVHKIMAEKLVPYLNKKY